MDTSSFLSLLTQLSDLIIKHGCRWSDLEEPGKLRQDGFVPQLLVN